MPLSPEDLDTAARLWREGYQSGHIVRHFGIYTRNQIIGALYRINVVGHKGNHKRYKRVAKDAIEHRIATRKRPQKVNRAIYVPPDAAQRSFNRSGPCYNIIALKRFQCHWPIGEPKDKDFCFCAAPTDGKSYCPHHAAIAYVSPWAR